MARPTLVLDLDGTLVDSLPDLRASLNRLLATRKLVPFAPAEVAGMIGDGAAALVRRAMAARRRIATDADVAEFLADYGAHAAEQTRPFPDAEPTLAIFRAQNWLLAVCTNKPAAPAHALLDALGLLPSFDAVGAGDSFPTQKPDPAHLLATIALAGGDPSAAVMVGDHRNDVVAGAGAAVPVIFARWGYGPVEMASGSAAIAKRFDELPSLAAGLLRASPSDT